MSKTYKQQIEAKRKLISKHVADLEKLLEDCPHEVVIRHEVYHPGGYDYTAETVSWDECELCHAEFNKVIENHGTFG